MCLLIYRPKDSKPIPEDYILDAAKDNPHGFGMAVRTGKTITAYRTLDMKQSLKAIREAEEANREFMAHFRYTTHGETNVKNAHPFYINDGAYLAHNGVLSVNIKTKKMSDTWHFAQTLRNIKVEKNINTVKAFFQVAENQNVIGGSKLVVMTKDGVYIHNEHKGTKIGGIWYSNTNFLPDQWSNWYGKSNRYYDWFDLREALERVISNQIINLDEMAELLSSSLVDFVTLFPEEASAILRDGSNQRVNNSLRADRKELIRKLFNKGHSSWNMLNLVRKEERKGTKTEATEAQQDAKSIDN